MIRAPTGETWGTVDAYWAANIDLTDILPELDLTIASGRSGPMRKSRLPPNLFTIRRAGADRP